MNFVGALHSNLFVDINTSCQDMFIAKGTGADKHFGNNRQQVLPWQYLITSARKAWGYSCSLRHPSGGGCSGH